MKPSDQPIYPVHIVYQDCGPTGDSGPYLTETIQSGVTLRQHYAGLALHAMLSGTRIHHTDVPKLAAKCADELIAELERTK